MRTVLLLGLAAAVCSVQGIRLVLDENVSLIEKMDPTSCPEGARYCAPNKCLRDEFWCDGEVDCDDRSDESNCPQCKRDGFRCDNKCIPSMYRCDGTKDCLDGADEHGCGVIAQNELFSCDNNATTRKLAARCDGHVHCADRSDEAECLTCVGGSIQCRTQAEDGTKDFVCAPPSFLCDGAVYCDYLKDERNCTFKLERSVIRKPMTSTISNSTAVRIVLDENVSPIGRLDPATCPSGTRYCPDNRCLKDEFWCDGNVDCKDALDEKNCSKCSPNALKCDGECKPGVLRCDGTKDCKDGTDESDCGVIGETDVLRFRGNVQRRIEAVCDGHVHVYNSGADEKSCEQYHCKGGAHYCEKKYSGEPACVAKAHLCDGYEFCADGSDETNCTFTVDKVYVPKGPEVQHITTTTTTASPLGVKRGECAPGSRWCLSSGLGRCLRDEYWCDGQADCDGLIDEVNCTTCSSLGWSCGDGKCIRKEYHCDGSNDDCEEEEDEQNCPERDSKHYFICDDHDVSRHKSLRCDGQKDCLDGKDEYRCTKCVAGAIYCDHHCLQASKVCDGQDDCYDGLDESNCTAPGKLAVTPKP